jgi:hypothetical protein
MPNQLKSGTRRLSYIESRETAKALDVLAAAKSTNVSALIREATSKYLKEVDRDGSIRKIANDLVAQLPDDADERATANLPEETLAELAGIMRKLRR